MSEYMPVDTVVNGKVYSVETMPIVYRRGLVRYFLRQYDFAESTSELVSKMNASSFYMKKLKRCFSFLK